MWNRALNRGMSAVSRPRCLQQDEELWCEQPRDAEQGGRKATIGVPEAVRTIIATLGAPLEVTAAGSSASISGTSVTGQREMQTQGESA
jgi:hypothetical protein